MITYLIIYLGLMAVISVFLGLEALQKKSRPLRFFVFMVVLFIFLPLLAGYVYFSYFGSLTEIAVPNVTGMTLEEAQQRLETLGLKGRVAGLVFETRFPEGFVTSQRPEGGRKVKLGRRINLLLSSGQQMVVVPDLLGKPFDQAEAVLQAAGLKLGEIRKEYVEGLDSGIILMQEPLLNEEAEVGIEVMITISDTKEMVGSVSEPKKATPEGWFKLW